MPVLLFLILLTGLGLATPAQARPLQDMQIVRQKAASYLLSRIRSEHEGLVADVEMGNVDERLALPRCLHLDFFQPSGAQGYSNGSVGVRCENPVRWTFYLTYQVVLSGPALVATRPLSTHQSISPGDVELRQVRYEGMPGNYLRDPAELRGAMTSRAIPAGTAITNDLLFRRQTVRAGQQVKVLVHGRGFQITQEGVALNSAHRGETVRVRTPSGQVIQGLAGPDGNIVVQP